MAEENKHPPTTEEQAPPEMSGKAPKMEQAEIPDVGGGPAPSAKVIDLSAMRSTPEKDAPTDIPKEPEAQPVSVTEYSKQEWKKPKAEPEKPKPKRGRPAKAEKAAPTEPGAKKEVKAEKSRRGRPPKAEKASPERAKPPKAGKTHAAPEEKAAPPAPEVPPTPRDATRAEKEEIVYLNLSDLHPFKDHPFGVRDDAEMKSLVESVRNGGVNQPALVRPREGGGYEIIAGHRRRHGSELAGLSAMPCIVRQMDDDTATILMVDSNIQRENILPSERAQAYKMKLEAIKRQGARTDLTSPQVAAKFRADDEVATGADVSGDTVRRYIRLTELSPELQQMVDEKKIGMTPAVEISYLKPEEQQMLLTAIDSEQATPSLSQAQRMKKLSRDGKLNDDTMLDIMMEQKKPEGYNVVLSADKLRKYFPRSYTPQKMEETILKLLDAWLRKRQRDQSR